MPKQNLKRKAPPEEKKHCRCTPFCGKKLTQQARRLHYKNLRLSQRDEMQESETATESNDQPKSGRASPTSINGSDDNENTSDSLVLGGKDHQLERHWMGNDSDEQQLEESSDNAKADPGPQDDRSEVSECASGHEELTNDSESDSEFDEWKDFDEVNEGELSDGEKLQELEEFLSAGEYAELWESRLYLTSCFLSI
jgi:hypothetical protein